MSVNPILYDDGNLPHKEDAEILFEMIENDFKNRNVGLAVDVGCGTGNVTNDFLNRTNCEMVIAVDKCKEMVDFARKRFPNNRMKFEVGNIEDSWSKLSSDINCIGNADVVFSNHCFHWVNDKQAAIGNIAEMLKPGGKCYITILFSSDMTPTYNKLKNHANWHSFFEQSEDYYVFSPESGHRSLNQKSDIIPIASTSDEKINEWQLSCENANLKECRVWLTKKEFTFDDYTNYQKLMASLCPLLAYIPEDRKTEFLNDHNDLVFNDHVKPQGMCPKVKIVYEYITIVAKKS